MRNRVLAQSHHARVLRSVGSFQRRAGNRCVWKERTRQLAIQTADRYLLTRNVSRLFVSRGPSNGASPCGRSSNPRCCIPLPSARIGATIRRLHFMVSRLTPRNARIFPGGACTFRSIHGARGDRRRGRRQERLGSLAQRLGVTEVCRRRPNHGRPARGSSRPLPGCLLPAVARTTAS